MREADLETDGWRLEDGEALHRQAPDTFWIPAAEGRARLHPGDLVKLVFRIALDNSERPFSVERMWVIVRERVGNQYLGILDNNPYALEENDELWSGVEIAFSPRHIIDIDLPNDASVAKARETPRRPWPRD